jgi:hypothetical protein
MSAKINEKRNYLVVKDNELIQKARFNLTATPQKLCPLMFLRKILIL